MYPNYLLISSKDRTNCEDSTNNFKIRLKYPIEHVNKVKLLKVSLPNTIYNVNQYNNQINVIINPFTVGTIIYLTPGAYNIDTLLVELKTQLESLTGTWNCTYDEKTFKINIENNDGFIGFGLDFRVSNSANELLGFCKKLYTVGAISS